MNVVIKTLFNVTLLVLSVKFMHSISPLILWLFHYQRKTHGNKQLSYASNKFPAQVTHHVKLTITLWLCHSEFNSL